MDIRTLIFADDSDANPRLYACGKCGNATSPKYFGGGPLGHTEAIKRATACCMPAAPDPDNFCKCGAKINRWSTACSACRDAAIIAKATIITEEPDVLVIVGTENYYQSVEEAAEYNPGAWAHPCDVIPLSVNAKSMAESAAETVCENMCEDAFEDASDHLNGVSELTAAFEVAIAAFNAAQTASSWQEDQSKVFKLPDAPAVAA